MNTNRIVPALLAAIAVIFIAAAVDAKDVVIKDRAFSRALSGALDAVDDVTENIADSDSGRRERETLTGHAEKVARELKGLRKTFRRGKEVDGGVLVNDRDLLDDARDARRATERLADAIADSDELAKRDRKRIKRALRKIEDSLDDVTDLIRKATGSKAKTPKVTGPKPMDRAAFGALLNQVKGSSFASDKTKVIRSAANKNHFTCDQVLTLIKTISFESDRIEAAAVLHPKTLDKKNWFKVYGAFSFSSSKDGLRRRVGD